MGEPQRLAMRSGAAPLAGTGVLQTQLTVGPVDDPFEREAERTADAVTASDANVSAFSGRPALAGSLMRVAQRAIGKTEPPKNKDNDEESRKQVQKSSTGAGPDTVPTGIERNIHAMSRGGEPLAPSLRSVFEPRFGYDFSGVDKPKNDKDFYGLRYAEFTVPLVKAVQEQQQIILPIHCHGLPTKY